MNVEQWLRSHGADGILEPSDIGSLVAAELRVLDLMSDHNWHEADAIREAASGDGPIQSEGLRRMRSLRPMLAKVGSEIKRKRVDGTRLFAYRITEPVPKRTAQKALF